MHAITIVGRRTTSFPMQMRRQRSLTALAFVSSMSESLRIKTCCSIVGVHHTVTNSSSSVASLSYADEVTPYADEVTPYDDNMEHAIR